MLPMPVIARSQIDSNVMLLAIILIPSFLFAVYKLISRCLRHQIEKLKIQNGIVSVRSKNHGGAKWVRSIYTAVGLLLGSGAFGWLLIIKFHGLNNPTPLILFVLLPFCVGIAYLIRGILKRKSYLRKLALNNGVPFEVIYPPQKHWILPVALGLPMLIYTGIIIALYIIMGPSGNKIVDVSMVVAFILGSMFFLYGLLMCIVISRNKAKAIAVDAKVASTNCQPTTDRQQDMEIV